MKTNKKTQFPWGEKREWAERTQLLAGMMPENFMIIDLGCGYCHLKKYLKMKKYVGVDRESWIKGVIKADFNKNQFPDLGAFDIILGQGILEYISDPENFMNQIHKYGDQVLITYKKISADDIERKNSMAFSDITKLFEKTGWKIIKHQLIGRRQKVWLLRKNESILA